MLFCCCCNFLELHWICLLLRMDRISANGKPKVGWHAKKKRRKTNLQRRNTFIIELVENKNMWNVSIRVKLAWCEKIDEFTEQQKISLNLQRVHSAQPMDMKSFLIKVTQTTENLLTSLQRQFVPIAYTVNNEKFRSCHRCLRSIQVEHILVLGLKFVYFEFW